MANTKSAEKRIRQTEATRIRNRAARSAMRTSIRKVREAAEAGEAATALEALPETLKVIDTSAQKGLIHRNAAARTKSRLVRAVQGTSEA